MSETLTGLYFMSFGGNLKSGPKFTETCKAQEIQGQSSSFTLNVTRSRKIVQVREIYSSGSGRTKVAKFIQGISPHE